VAVLGEILANIRGPIFTRALVVFMMLSCRGQRDRDTERWRDGEMERQRDGDGETERWR